KTNSRLARAVAAGETLPRGTDTVLSAEEVRPSSSSIHVTGTPVTGALVDQVGSEVKKGEKLLDRGTVLRVQDVGLLTSVGLRRISVFQSPRVAILPIRNGGTSETLEATS